MPGQIKYTQQLIESLLLAEPYFENIPILRADDKDLDYIIESQVAKIGVCVLIMMPTLTCEKPNIPGPSWLIKVACQVWEIPIINRSSTGTNKEASEIAETVQATVHLKDPNGDGALVSDSESVVPILRDEKSLVYSNNFTRRAGIRLEQLQVATPTITDDGSAFQPARSARRARWQRQYHARVRDGWPFHLLHHER